MYFSVEGTYNLLTTGVFYKCNTRKYGTPISTRIYTVIAIFYYSIYIDTRGYEDLLSMEPWAAEEKAVTNCLVSPTPVRVPSQSPLAPNVVSVR